jgi:hypothetical protein
MHALDRELEGLQIVSETPMEAWGYRG